MPPPTFWLTHPFAGKFGKMFPLLAPWHTDERTPDAYLKEISAFEHFLFSAQKGISTIPAGYTYFGQFLAHDLTLDPTSLAERLEDRECVWNYRNPALNLDSLYGGGPWNQPYLFDRNYHFVLETIQVAGQWNISFYDLPRYHQRALIPDDRNDENLIISQLHVAFMIFHNRIIDKLLAAGEVQGEELFLEARRLTLWHYQYVVMHDYLKRILGEKTWTEAMRLLTINTAGHRDAFLPLEFASAVFRFGHSQVRETYQFNNLSKELATRPLPILRGTPPETYVDWRFFFGEGYLIPNEEMQRWPIEQIEQHFNLECFTRTNRVLTFGHRISPQFVDSLYAMGPSAMNLVEKNLLRGLKHHLPSGQAVANSLGLEFVDWTKLNFLFYPTAPGDTQPKFPPTLLIEKFQETTPLYYYILAEALEKASGNHLGDVGGFVVKTVLLDLLRSDPHSYLNQDPHWTPTDEHGHAIVNFGMADLLQMAGVYEGALVQSSPESAVLRRRLNH